MPATLSSPSAHPHPFAGLCGHVLHESFDDPDAATKYDPRPLLGASDEFPLGYMPDEVTRDCGRRMHYAAYRSRRAIKPTERRYWRNAYFALRDRIVDVLNLWVTAEGFAALDERHVLDAPDLDRAVAHGAAYYGLARRGRGVRIRSGAARSYYVGIESAMPAVPGLPAPMKALCVVPFGMEEGTSAAIRAPEFGAVVGEPVEFRFLSSTVRKTDPVGALIEDWGDDLVELSPMEVTLNVDGSEEATIPVTLESRMTEVGTLELWCVARDGARRWRLELNIRERDAD